MERDAPVAFVPAGKHDCMVSLGANLARFASISRPCAVGSPNGSVKSVTVLPGTNTGVTRGCGVLTLTGTARANGSAAEGVGAATAEATSAPKNRPADERRRDIIADGKDRRQAGSHTDDGQSSGRMQSAGEERMQGCVCVPYHHRCFEPFATEAASRGARPALGRMKAEEGLPLAR